MKASLHQGQVLSSFLGFFFGDDFTPSSDFLTFISKSRTLSVVKLSRLIFADRLLPKSTDSQACRVMISRKCGWAL